MDFAFPGRDRSATAIEEVALRFQARDDFGVESLTLHYAINGGAWRDIATVPAGARETLLSHTFEFEQLGVDERRLRPGDVLSVYVAAEDARQTTKSALYFVDVRPFDKRYRERQGSGGGGGGDSPLELSARQREIVAATWNLIRERDIGERGGEDLRDQVDTIALLQGTLKSQVETLVARAEGRRLSEDEQVEPFVAELTAAATAMADAEQTLTAHDLETALSPQRQALQHLLAAEASLRDVDVTLSQDGGGDSAGRSLAELADLELDPERNRYETPQTPRFGERDESGDDEWRRLEELARRHEQFARGQERGDAAAPLSRWHLQHLQRQLDTLQRRLAERQPAGQGGGMGSAALADIDRVRAAVDRSLGEDDMSAEAFRQGAQALRAGAEALRRQGRRELAIKRAGPNIAPRRCRPSSDALRNVSMRCKTTRSTRPVVAALARSHLTTSRWNPMRRPSAACNATSLIWRPIWRTSGNVSPTPCRTLPGNWTKPWTNSPSRASASAWRSPPSTSRPAGHCS